MVMNNTNRVSFACITLAVLPLVGCQIANDTTHNNQIEQKQIIQEARQQTTKATANDNNLQDMLISYNWQLQSAVDSNNKPINVLTNLQKPAQLQFYQNDQGLSASFSVGCNQISGAVKLTNNNISIDGNQLMMTQMYCQELNDAEKKLTDLMSGNSTLLMTSNFTANADQVFLQQTKSDGSRIKWQGTLTNTVKYGKGERIFLEVAPKTAKCSSGINGQCLQVRDVYYDKKGIKTGVGKWRLMSKTIKGYTHNPNLRQVLRLKKYVTDPVDVKGKQIVYAFDMAVETEFLNVK